HLRAIYKSVVFGRLILFGEFYPMHDGSQEKFRDICTPMNANCRAVVKADRRQARARFNRLEPTNLFALKRDAHQRRRVIGITTSSSRGILPAQ
ncbi:MAG TPA: hypothetical protein VGA33_06035, partial [Thermoanaerobaculia bacterium]